jgi:hypothetical protein
MKTLRTSGFVSVTSHMPGFIFSGNVADYQAPSHEELEIATHVLGLHAG